MCKLQFVYQLESKSTFCFYLGFGAKFATSKLQSKDSSGIHTGVARPRNQKAARVQVEYWGRRNFYRATDYLNRLFIGELNCRRSAIAFSYAASFVPGGACFAELLQYFHSGLVVPQVQQVCFFGFLISQVRCIIRRAEREASVRGLFEQGSKKT